MGSKETIILQYCI